MSDKPTTRELFEKLQAKIATAIDAHLDLYPEDQIKLTLTLFREGSGSAVTERLYYRLRQYSDDDLFGLNECREGNESENS